MNHPLISRLTEELRWPSLTDEKRLKEFIGPDGWHVVFVPGNAARNLESADVAVILPELKMAFQDKFDSAVVDDAYESKLRHDVNILQTPSLLFFFSGEFIGGIPKVRDWDEYLIRIGEIFSAPSVAAQ